MFVSGYCVKKDVRFWQFVLSPKDLSYCYCEEIASLAIALSTITSENSKEMYSRLQMPHALSNFKKSPTFRWSFQQKRFYSYIANFWTVPAYFLWKAVAKCRGLFCGILRIIMKELTFSSEIKSSNHWKSNFCSSEFNCLFLCFSNLFIYFFVLFSRVCQ